MRGRLPRMSVMNSLGSASADDPTESNDCYPYARLNRAALLLLVAAPTLIRVDALERTLLASCTTYQRGESWAPESDVFKPH